MSATERFPPAERTDAGKGEASGTPSAMATPHGGHAGDDAGMSRDPLRLVLITGLSGSGKSVVAKCFEDLGFYTVDNLPLPLLREFLERPGELVLGHERIAVVADLRTPGFAEEFPKLIAEIDSSCTLRSKVPGAAGEPGDPVPAGSRRQARQARQARPTLLFLEASDEVLVRRFSETRRPHPLAPDQPVIAGIRRERELLAGLRPRADLVFDTSQWSIHETRNEVYRAFAAAGEEPEMVVSLVSFGFKHGIPAGTDLLFDVRFLANPHFVPGLREQTGQDAAVLEYLAEQPDFEELISRLADLLGFLLPRYRRENRSYLSVAVGCTGGRHRSVAVCERLKERLDSSGWEGRLIHRDISR
ncbi:MAG TPA: RNase adapter RapZ [Thermoanaerobaculia bacterium]|nr:RNase adapter RapZ [Thermoanaerobaculia bacterium]